MSDVRVTKEMPVKCGKCKECIKKLFDQKWVSSPALGYNCKIMKNELNDTGHWIEIDKMYRFCPLPKEPTESRCLTCKDFNDNFTKFIDLQAENSKLNSELDERQKQFECANTGWNKAMDKWQDLQRENNKLKAENERIGKYYKEASEAFSKQLELRRKADSEIERLKSERDNIIIELNSMGYILNDGKISRPVDTGSIANDVMIKLTKDEIEWILDWYRVVYAVRNKNSFTMSQKEINLKAKLEAIE
jgi:predicted RNase H-like nuclease (RuvC/YqgF family)